MADEVQAVMSAIMFGESPRWHEKRLWFCDWGAHEVIAVDLMGSSEVILKVASFPFSIDWLADGRLLIVSASDRRLLRREPDGSLRTYADLAGLSRFPWNEIVVDGRGNAYVNNIGFNMMAGGEVAPGTLAVVGADGSAREVADGVEFPNGMVVTPDHATLILAESYANRLTAFDIAADGSLSNRRIWAALGDGVPDGICLDRENAVWYADVPNKRCVRVREGGEVLQTIELDRGCFACMLGGAEGATLYMVAREWDGLASTSDGARTGQLLAAEAPAPGAGWP
jgi:sugar lactone lactonase YvrE